MSRKPSPQPKSDRSREAKIEAVLGAAGAGKTTYVMRELDRLKPQRLLIWDTKGEFGREGYGVVCRSMADVVRRVRAAGSGGFKIAFIPDGSPAQIKEAFDVFAQLAFVAKNLTIVAEELGDVCDGGNCKSPGWRRVITQGRTEGLHIYALSQRPTLIDKNTLGSASITRCGRLNWVNDAKVMANILRTSADELLDMAPLQFIQRTDRGEVTRGKLTF
ncbi:hypothetical protein SAMN02745857_03890 [Andreprevotia lacus DSM 23236]|jgi:hypothetical protein|uniref:Uncharacterized protein n=1 Tax=Andreprevotia lacus DSM 23236 TaxID=1121001 RepID=A0A1W1Y146_9NEIS|nr:hypothetical protein [Andreprevotia lacus]SMC29521.1 hypothetical protein SAMN02745857_03890 [Andreprevotia lacus DSM 23236]